MTTMKMAVILALALVVGACGGKGPPRDGPAGGGTVNGLVTDVGTGARLAGVAVSGGGKSTTTDAQGEFTLSGLPSGSVELTFQKDGYAPGYTTPRVGESATPALMSLKKAGRLQPYNASANSTLVERTEAGPYAVILSPNSLDTTATSLRVSVTPLDPTKEQSSLPGELTSGGASPSLLVPVTFAEFTILDPSGARVNLKSDKSAIVELPIPPALRPRYPLGTTIHCYAYNPTTGKWEDFVEGNVVLSSVDGVSPVLKASVRHFSWYGGAPQGNNCVMVAGQVVSAVDGKPLPNARVEAFPGTSTYTDANGTFSVLTLDGSNTTFAASRTYYLSQETEVGGVRLPAGAKVIEFGKVDYTLTGLVRVPCSGASGLVASTESALQGERSNPVVVRVGTISRFSYEATGFLDASQGTSGNVFLLLERGIRGASGNLEQLKEPASGAKVWLTTPSGQTVNLAEAAAGTGTYVANNAPITAGQSYTISIDPEGTGTVKGSGSVFAVGNITWRNPTQGARLPASNLRVQWSDSGSSGGNPNYAGYYLVYLIKSDGSDSAIYQGSNQQFDARSASTGGALRPGGYQGSIWGVSGPFAPGSGGFATPTNNITGPDVNGKFYSLTTGPMIGFTLQ